MIRNVTSSLKQSNNNNLITRFEHFKNTSSNRRQSILMQIEILQLIEATESAFGELFELIRRHVEMSQSLETGESFGGDRNEPIRAEINAVQSDHSIE